MSDCDNANKETTVPTDVVANGTQPAQAKESHESSEDEAEITGPDASTITEATEVTEDTKDKHDLVDQMKINNDKIYKLLTKMKKEKAAKNQIVTDEDKVIDLLYLQNKISYRVFNRLKSKNILLDQIFQSNGDKYTTFIKCHKQSDIAKQQTQLTTTDEIQDNGQDAQPKEEEDAKPSSKQSTKKGGTGTKRGRPKKGEEANQSKPKKQKKQSTSKGTVQQAVPAAATLNATASKTTDTRVEAAVNEKLGFNLREEYAKLVSDTAHNTRNKKAPMLLPPNIRNVIFQKTNISMMWLRATLEDRNKTFTTVVEKDMKNWPESEFEVYMNICDTLLEMPKE